MVFLSGSHLGPTGGMEIGETRLMQDGLGASS